VREYNRDTSRWLLEGFSDIVRQHEVLATVSVWFKDSARPIEYEYEVGETIYKIHNSWKIRPLSQRHRLPAEYVPSIVAPPGFPVLKIFIDLYADEFGAYRNHFYKLNGVYLQLGNMPFNMRKQIRNHFLIGFVPFGGHLKDFLEPFCHDVRALQHGVFMSTKHGQFWVVAAIGCVTADLPQGNDFARVKRHGANHGCRTCMADQMHLTDSKYDHIANARFNQETKKKIEQLENLSTSLARERWSTEHGLMLKSGPLDMLIWDRHTQTPQDAYHSMAGKTIKLLDLTMNLFSNGGQEQWLYYWKRIEKPTRWSALPNPLTHLHSFTFSDVLNIAMLVPFILRRFLAPLHLKSHIRCEFKNRLGLQRDSQVINNIINCWVVVAKSLKMVFSRSFTELDYNSLQSTLNEERDILVKVRKSKK